MNIQFVTLPPIPLAMVRHTGSYESLSHKFDQLWQWVTLYGIPANRSIGLYYDNPEHVAENKLRSAACAELLIGHSFTGVPGLPIEIGQINPGNYALTTYTGPYDAMEPVWSQFTRELEEKMAITILDQPGIEIYINDPADVPASQLITELYLPIQAPRKQSFF